MPDKGWYYSEKGWVAKSILTYLNLDVESKSALFRPSGDSVRELETSRGMTLVLQKTASVNDGFKYMKDGKVRYRDNQI